MPGLQHAVHCYVPGGLHSNPTGFGVAATTTATTTTSALLQVLQLLEMLQ